jgi:hypothetical protein
LKKVRRQEVKSVVFDDLFSFVDDI